METSASTFNLGLLGKQVILKEDSLLYVCDTQFPVERMFLRGTRGRCWHRGDHGAHLPPYALVELEDGTSISSFENQWEEINGD